VDVRGGSAVPAGDPVVVGQAAAIQVEGARVVAIQAEDVQAEVIQAEVTGAAVTVIARASQRPRRFFAGAVSQPKRRFPPTLTFGRPRST
jgi:hypothetical protein